MPAHGSPQHVPVVSRPDAAGDHSAPHSSTPCQRVMSVSPHAPMHGQHAMIEDVNQKLLDEGRAMRDLLRGLIEQARTIAEKLSTLATSASEGEAQAAQAVVHLQERLRLGAQMLKAFQSQIGRIDHSLEQLKAQERRAEAAEAKKQQRAIDMQSKIDAALAEFSQRLEQMMQAAMEKMNRMADERAAAIAARLSNHSPPHADPPSSSSTELHQLTVTLREVAQRLAALTDKSAAPVVIEEKPRTIQPVAPASADEERPAIHVNPPLRFHTWTSRG